MWLFFCKNVHTDHQMCFFKGMVIGSHDLILIADTTTFMTYIVICKNTEIKILWQKQSYSDVTSRSINRPGSLTYLQDERNFWSYVWAGNATTFDFWE